eukprot:c20757_g1_i3.p1 GENE.c20757_g1_i3~~c20757_g1_i3.p1  ORF type:complete len:240 (+),score=87.97 c20757_g1_i3:627-1346(+)
MILSTFSFDAHHDSTIPPGKVSRIMTKLFHIPAGIATIILKEFEMNDRHGFSFIELIRAANMGLLPLLPGSRQQIFKYSVEGYARFCRTIRALGSDSQEEIINELTIKELDQALSQFQISDEEQRKYIIDATIESSASDIILFSQFLKSVECSLLPLTTKSISTTTTTIQSAKQYYTKIFNGENEITLEKCTIVLEKSNWNHKESKLLSNSFVQDNGDKINFKVFLKAYVNGLIILPKN